MDLSKIEAVVGSCIRVVVEIPYGVVGAKYEFDEKSGAMMLDRVMKTPMHYPCNYGFIPNTIGGDGDALDVMLACSADLHVGVVVNARPIGVLLMSDEKGRDEKILAVVDCDDLYRDVISYLDLPILTEKIEYFFARYKDLDRGKATNIERWEGSEYSWTLIKNMCS